MALKDVLNQFKDIYNKLSVIQRISIAAAIGAVFVVLIVLVIWANKPAYKTLYGNLSQSDASQVIERLKEKRIPYQLKDNGATIDVPEQNVYETRLDLARDGLPTGGGAGFELFDKSSYGMTEFLQDVNYKRALQGELARTISSFKKIQEARVHLTIPKDRLFIGDEDKAKAAIIVKLKGGYSLGKEDVMAIASLVSGAVKGLGMEDIQIVDTNGKLLSDMVGKEDDPETMTENQMSYKQRVERGLEGKVNEILSKTLGKGNAIAKVTVEIDFSKRETTSEIYGKDAVVRSSQTSEIESKNSPDTPQGVPGVQSNLAEPDLLAGKMSSEYSKTDETTNYEVDKTITKEVKAFGTLSRVTVAVVVDNKKAKEQTGEEVKIVSNPRTEQELTTIRNLVAMTVGYDQNRGDMIEVSNIPFDTTVEKEELTQLKKDKMVDYIIIGVRYLTAIIVLLLFYFLVIRRIIKKMDKTVTINDDGTVTVAPRKGDQRTMDIALGESGELPKSLEELEAEIENELTGNVPVDVESVKSKVMLKKLEEYASEDPEGLANLIKTVIKGGGN